MYTSSLYRMIPCFFLWIFFIQHSFYSYPQVKEEDPTDILRTINYYFYGENLGTVSALTTAYHEHATFTYIDSEKDVYHSFPIEEYVRNISQNPPPYVDRELILKSIDITGNVAIANTQVLYKDRGKRLNEYLSLLRIGKQWKIIHRLSYKEFASFDISVVQNNIQFQEAKIERILDTYLEGRETKNEHLLNIAFHPQSEMYHVAGSYHTVHQLSFEAFKHFHSHSSSETYKSTHHIDFIKTIGNIGIAKVSIRCKPYNTTLTDYISLAKVNNQWQIVKKVSQQDKLPTHIIM